MASFAAADQLTQLGAQSRPIVAPDVTQLRGDLDQIAGDATAEFALFDSWRFLFGARRAAHMWQEAMGLSYWE